MIFRKKNADAIISIGMWSKEYDAEKTVNSGIFDRKQPFLCGFYAQCFVVQNKYITLLA